MYQKDCKGCSFNVLTIQREWMIKDSRNAFMKRMYVEVSKEVEEYQNDYILKHVRKVPRTNDHTCSV